MKNLKNSLKKVLIIFAVIFSSSSFFAQGKDVLSIYNNAVELQSTEDWYAASQYFIEVINLNPAFSDAWYRLAECSYKLGDYDLALQYLTQAERYEKTNSSIQNLKGMIFLALDNTKEAEQIFNNVLKRYPNDIDAHFGLAEIELYNGKFSGAESQYIEALKRQNTNRKALLSLALVCAETGRFNQAQNYLNQAMQFYSGESEVHYLSAVIYLMKGDYALAENHAKIAVEINGNYNKAYELLSTILFLENRYSEVIDLCDFLIGKDRNNSFAWYLKGVAFNKSGQDSEAIEIWSTGLEINPQDELMRAQLEMAVRAKLSLTDPRRAEWAEFHIENAALYASRYDKSGSVYEYQKALLLDPKNKKARLAYAELLEMNGMHESYLNQLRFVQDNFKLNTALEDTIEAYNSLLEDTLAKQWNVDPFYLDKTRWNIAVFYKENSNNIHHPDSQKLAALACSDIFSGIAITNVKTQVTPIKDYAEAFKNARFNNFDYFVMISLNEGEEDISLRAQMFSGRNGTQTFDNYYYAVGNNRFSTVLRRFRNSILDQLTVRGKIIARNGKTVLVDLGKTENIQKDAEFKIIKKGKVKPVDTGFGLIYKDDDVLGTVVISNAGEEVSEALITQNGFYDRINAGDEVVLVSVPETSEAVIDNVPNATEKGKNVVNNNVKGEELVKEIKRFVEHPAILEILRDIY